MRLIQKGLWKSVLMALLCLTLFALNYAARAEAIHPCLKQVQEESLAKVVSSTLEGWLPEQLKESEIPGAAVVVVDDKSIIWEETYGHVDGPESRAIDPDTLFCVRSVSKGFTALALLMAVQDGLVDLDTPIKEYLPDFRINSRFNERPEELITIRHLLSHWGGFAHDAPQIDDSSESNTFERHVGNISKTWLRYPVGYHFEYSNLDVDLAGYIVQVRSGKPFAQYMKEKVLDAIGMSDSTFDLELAAQRENRALGHHPDGSAADVRLPEIPAGGLYSTIRDMAKYAQFQLNGGVVNGRRILREDLMKEYHTIQFARFGQRSGYCLGLYREVCGTTYDIYHPGGGRGWQSIMLAYPELKIGVVLMTNRIWHNVPSKMKNTVNEQISNRVGPNPIEPFSLEGMSRLAMDDPRIQLVLGKYGDGNGNIVIGIENNVLCISENDGQFQPLTMYGDGGELIGTYGDVSEIRFLPDLGGQRGSLMNIDHRSGFIRYFDFNDSPFDPAGPDKPEWQKLVGEYDVLWDGQPFFPVTISIKNGYLYLNDGKCTEYLPGLFFTFNGNALDFQSDPPMSASLALSRKATPAN